jgi:hypothetical protein
LAFLLVLAGRRGKHDPDGAGHRPDRLVSSRKRVDLR